MTDENESPDIEWSYAEEERIRGASNDLLNALIQLVDAITAFAGDVPGSGPKLDRQVKLAISVIHRATGK